MLIDLNDAHRFSSRNKNDLQNDSVCGCIYCLKVFSPSEIDRYLTDGTALCPYCGIDSVIGESSGYPITDEFLQPMHTHWFAND